MRRLLKELTRAGIVVQEHERYRLADDLDPALREALEELALLRD